jgi:siroheme synthase (precorrin-2 oxidase/ferrochelatase)
LKEDNRFLTKISKEYMKKENIIEVAEFTELYKDDLEEENKELKERIRFLEQCLDNKEKVNKSLREENKRLSDFLECES